MSTCVYMIFFEKSCYLSDRFFKNNTLYTTSGEPTMVHGSDYIRGGRGTECSRLLHNIYDW